MSETELVHAIIRQLPAEVQRILIASGIDTLQQCECVLRRLDFTNEQGARSRTMNLSISAVMMDQTVQTSDIGIESTPQRFQPYSGNSRMKPYGWNRNRPQNNFSHWNEGPRRNYFQARQGYRKGMLRVDWE